MLNTPRSVRHQREVNNLLLLYLKDLNLNDDRVYSLKRERGEQLKLFAFANNIVRRGFAMMDESSKSMCFHLPASMLLMLNQQKISGATCISDFVFL